MNECSTALSKFNRLIHVPLHCTVSGRDRGIDRRNYDRVEDGDVAMTASVLTRGSHMQQGSYRLNIDSR